MLRQTMAGTPAWKLGLIPVLALVLFKVTRPAASDLPLPETSGSEQSASASQPGNGAAKSTAVLPDLSLEDALKFDPFGSLPMPERVLIEPPPPVVVETPVLEPVAEPVAPLTPVVNPLMEKAATLKQLKVSAVFPSPKGSVAIVDSKTVRVGDLLSPGVRVVEIRGTDVILRVEDSEAAPGTVSGVPQLR